MANRNSAIYLTKSERAITVQALESMKGTYSLWLNALLASDTEKEFAARNIALIEDVLESLGTETIQEMAIECYAECDGCSYIEFNLFPQYRTVAIPIQLERKGWDIGGVIYCPVCVAKGFTSKRHWEEVNRNFNTPPY